MAGTVPTPAVVTLVRRPALKGAAEIQTRPCAIVGQRHWGCGNPTRAGCCPFAQKTAQFRLSLFSVLCIQETRQVEENSPRNRKQGEFRGSSYWHNAAVQQVKHSPGAQAAHNSGGEFSELETWLPPRFLYVAPEGTLSRKME